MSNSDIQDAPSEIQVKIYKQVEYYFGDFNMPRDRFLREQVKLDEGWIKLDTLLTFNRLKALTTEPSVVIEALKKSPNNIVEINEDETKVRRSLARPLPEANPEQQQKLDEVTLYVKGFPRDTQMDDLLEFFGKFGSCINVFMRRTPAGRVFKGSVFVTYSTKDEAEQFLELESVKYNEIELLRCMKKEHSAKKQRQRQERQAEKAKKKSENSSGKGEKEEKEEQLELENITLGCILKLEGLAQDTAWQDVKTFFAPYAEVAFVDYTAGDATCAVRFLEEGSASAVLEKLRAADEKIHIKGSELTATVLEGDEELEYWKKTAAAKKDRRERMKHGRGGGRGRPRGRGGRRGGERGRGVTGRAKPTEKAENDAGKNDHSEKSDVEKPAQKVEVAETDPRTGLKRGAADSSDSPPEKRERPDAE